MRVNFYRREKKFLSKRKFTRIGEEIYHPNYSIFVTRYLKRREAWQAGELERSRRVAHQRRDYQ
jgi:hypothetical protein